MNKAGRLAAERHRILADPTIPNATVLAMTKSKAKELIGLTKRIRTGGTTHGTTVTGGKDDEDDDAMLVSPLEHKLDKILRATEKTLKQQPPTPFGTTHQTKTTPQTSQKRTHQTGTGVNEYEKWMDLLHETRSIKRLGQFVGCQCESNL